MVVIWGVCGAWWWRILRFLTMVLHVFDGGGCAVLGCGLDLVMCGCGGGRSVVVCFGQW